MTLPSGASLNYTNHYAEQVEKIIQKNPAVASVMSQVSMTSVNIRVTLKPWGERRETTAQVIADLNPELVAIPGTYATAYLPDVV